MIKKADPNAIDMNEINTNEGLEQNQVEVKLKKNKKIYNNL